MSDSEFNILEQHEDELSNNGKSSHTPNENSASKRQIDLSGSIRAFDDDDEIKSNDHDFAKEEEEFKHKLAQYTTPNTGYQELKSVDPKLYYTMKDSTSK